MQKIAELIPRNNNIFLGAILPARHALLTMMFKLKCGYILREESNLNGRILDKLCVLEIIRYML